MLTECQACGACCMSESSAYVPLTEGDRARLADDTLTHVEAGARYMAMSHGRCVALRVGPRDFGCSVYHRRPAVCRELERGTPACREERTLKRSMAARLLLAATDGP